MDNHRQRVRRPLIWALGIWTCTAHALMAADAKTQADVTAKAVAPGLVIKIESASQQLEMVVNNSRLLKFDGLVKRLQVNNPEVLEATFLSENELQVFAKVPGVTQINLWREDDSILSVDVIVYADARELSMLLNSQFPNARLKVIPMQTSVIISGYVDQPHYIPRIIEIAQDYHPKIINNIRIDGVQQVLLHVKVMEISRTKLRNHGIDWSLFNSNDQINMGVAGLIGAVAAGGGSSSTRAPQPGILFGAEGTGAARAATAAGAAPTMSAGIVSGNTAFFGVLDSLVQKNLAKTLSEPTLVTVSGRPAYFNVGGEVPVPASGLGAANVTFRPFGTQVDFVPIVRGGGKLRLEVRPRISEVDPSIAVSGIPGFRVRVIDTGVDMQAGETLALGGLVQKRVESQTRGLPWLSELPYAGALFRKTNERDNEVELLIMVTPQLVGALACEEVPPGGPGAVTTTPTEWEYFMKGYIEVPGDAMGGNKRTPIQDQSWNGYNPLPRRGMSGPCPPQGGGGEVIIESDGTSVMPREPEPAEPVPMPEPALPDSAEAASARPSTPAQRTSSRRVRPPVPDEADVTVEPSGQGPKTREAPPGLIGPRGYDVEK